jgi:hypothetical protein
LKCLSCTILTISFQTFLFFHFYPMSIMQYLQSSLLVLGYLSYASARAIVPRDQSVKDVFAAVCIFFLQFKSSTNILDHSLHFSHLATMPYFISMCCSRCIVDSSLAANLVSLLPGAFELCITKWNKSLCSSSEESGNYLPLQRNGPHQPRWTRRIRS